MAKLINRSRTKSRRSTMPSMGIGGSRSIAVQRTYNRSGHLSSVFVKNPKNFTKPSVVISEEVVDDKGKFISGKGKGFTARETNSRRLLGRSDDAEKLAVSLAKKGHGRVEILD